MHFNLNDLEVISFDCYGTLIDWEHGLIGAIKPFLAANSVSLPDADILELYAGIESELERGPYQKYRDILRGVVRRFGVKLGFLVDPADEDLILQALPEWKPFADAVETLKNLKARYRLALWSNIDRDLWEHARRHLKVSFDWVITAEDAGAYKPSPVFFRKALETVGRLPARILHVAQSLYHDIAPARELSIPNVRVNHRQGKSGPGATPALTAVPDWEIPDLKTLAQLLIRD
jgi:2-haloacid dehalogenase